MYTWQKRGLIFVPSGDGVFKSHAARPVPFPLRDDVIRLFYSSRDHDDRMLPAFIDVDANDPARILAAADSYQAMLERRPHRPALDAAGAEAELLRDAREGRLCPEAVDAVLAAAGHRVAKRPRELPAGLTDRELEVLHALAAGKTNKEIAETLGISAKTAGHHVQHIFDKTGVRTRSAATVWAFECHFVPSA